MLAILSNVQFGVIVCRLGDGAIGTTAATSRTCELETSWRHRLLGGRLGLGCNIKDLFEQEETLSGDIFFALGFLCHIGDGAIGTTAATTRRFEQDTLGWWIGLFGVGFRL